MIEALDLTRLPRVLFGASGVDVVGTTERVRKVPQPITASDVGIGTRRRLPRNPVRASAACPSPAPGQPRRSTSVNRASRAILTPGQPGTGGACRRAAAPIGHRL